MFQRSLINAAAFSPDLMSRPSAWLGHLPFATWVIQEIHPKCFVELGTHFGHSYFAFCKSIVEAGIFTKCYAVDTWQGDDHSGKYSDVIYREVDAHNTERYSDFSRLLRMTFDDAANYFSDQSVDLLHIDGLHTYEAVRHDFESWLPKLAPGAVVMFHDTNVRERNFGVWKFWEELQLQYPNNLEFVHSHGLGILQLNNVSKIKGLSWLDPNAPEKQQLIKYFSALGSRQLERYELSELKTQASTLSQFVADRDESIAALSQIVANRQEEIAALSQVVTDRDKQISALNQSVTERDDRIAALLSSTSWRLTKVVRRCSVHISRAKFLLRSLVLKGTQTFNSRNTFIRLIRIYKREGSRGILSRIKFYLKMNLIKKGIAKSTLDYGDTKTSFCRSEEIVRHHQSVDIIVCVHNALKDVKLCLESILRNTYPPYRLIIVDDGSDQQTKEYLEGFVVGQPAILIRNDLAIGYTKAANTGMRASAADFILLLNSDTIVPFNWLDRLIQCANSSDQIGMVGPLSNTASWQSVPDISNDSGDWSSNPLPMDWSVNDFSNEVARVSSKIYPNVGFLNGFCLLIKRVLLDDIGLFDEDSFARGYGEENDYALRATERNWKISIADDCYVYHAQSKSYSHQKRVELAKLADAVLANKHGHQKIGLNLALTQHHPALYYVRRRCKQIEESRCLQGKILTRFEGKRVLFILPVRSAGGGGNIVLLEAARMRELGVDAWIVNLESNRLPYEKNYPDNQVPTLYMQSHEDLPNIAVGFDAVIATLFLTVFWLESLKKLKQYLVLGYYIQDFEPDFFEEGSDGFQSALASYTAIPDIRLFTKTIWNREILRNKLNLSPTVIGPSFDADRFHPSNIDMARKDIVRIVAMVRPSTPRRAPVTTMNVLMRAASQYAQRIDITIFGANSDDPLLLSYSNKFLFKNLGEIDAGAMASAFRNSDIFVDCSLFQAMGLSAMEAMASGVAVVGPLNGGLKEIILNGHNGILIDTQNEDQIYLAVERLVLDWELRTRIKRNAFDVLTYTPDASCFNILDLLFPDPTDELKTAPSGNFS